VAVSHAVCAPWPTPIEPQVVVTASSVHACDATPLVRSLAAVEIVSVASRHQPFVPDTVHVPFANAVAPTLSSLSVLHTWVPALPAESVGVSHTVCVPCPTTIAPHVVDTASSVHACDATPDVASEAAVEMVREASLHHPLEP